MLLRPQLNIAAKRYSLWLRLRLKRNIKQPLKTKNLHSFFDNHPALYWSVDFTIISTIGFVQLSESKSSFEL